MAELNESYAGDIVRYVRHSLETEPDFHFLRFEFLQRTNIVHQQLRLVRAQTRFQRESQAEPAELDALGAALRDYTTAVRDYEFLRQHKTLGDTDALNRKLLLKGHFLAAPDYNNAVDPFKSEYCMARTGDAKFDMLRRFFMRHLPVRLTYSAVERKERAKEYEEGRPPKQVSVTVDRLVRLISSLTGGAFVVVPMFAMSISPSRTKSLVTVSMAVVVFACVLSLGIRVSTLQTLLATTTYAAVLVVFVGTTAGDSSQGS